MPADEGGEEREADPHGGQPIITAGAPAQAAEIAVVLLHGRGATAQGIINLVEPIYRHGVAFFAPEASRSRWYPYSFLAPIERNEPWVSSAIELVEDVLAEVSAQGIPIEKTVLLGFSQGACLAAEFAARNPRRYGGVVVLSGGLIGSEVGGMYDGSFEGASVFLGCGEHDEHVPIERIHETARVFHALDADVTERVYDAGHEVVDDEFAYVDALLETLI